MPNYLPEQNARAKVFLMVGLLMLRDCLENKARFSLLPPWVFIKPKNPQRFGVERILGEGYKPRELISCRNLRNVGGLSLALQSLDL